jgi:hypothetical protein
MPIAAMANAARRTEAALGPVVRCGQGRAGERMGFIFSGLNQFVQENVYSEIGVRRHPIKVATIRLQ